MNNYREQKLIGGREVGRAQLSVIEEGVGRNASGEVECEQSPEYAEEPCGEGGEHTHGDAKHC